MAEAERHRLEKLFHNLDANKDGRVDPSELAQGIKKMGYYHVTEEQIIVRFLEFRTFLTPSTFEIIMVLRLGSWGHGKLSI